MKILKDESLKRYTTVHIGGNARTMYIPESRDELVELVNHTDASHLLGGGSNLLITDAGIDEVINLREFDKKIESLGNGHYYVGASVRLQSLILDINKDGYGGIEYLFSVPGLVGGAIVMNAGGGVEEGWSISDHIISVTVLHNGKITTLTKDACGFSHRKSIFKNDSSYIVLAAELVFDAGTEKEFKEKRDSRIRFCKKYQDNGKPNFGSVFCTFDPYVMEAIRRVPFGKKKSVHFSPKTGNWIVNEKGGTFEEVCSCMKKVEKLHALLGKKCAPEVIIWK